MSVTPAKLTATDLHAITHAGPDGCASWDLHVTPATRKKSTERMQSAGLVAVNAHGAWLTPAGWAMRQERRATEGLPAEDVVTWVLVLRKRAAGAVPVAYAATVNRRHVEEG